MFYCKACASRIICQLFATRPVPAAFVCRLPYYKACAGQLRLPAVFAARPVPVGSSAGCFTTRPVPVSFTTGLFCYNGLAMPCLPAFAMTPCLLALVHLPPFIAMCTRIIARAAGTAL